MGLFDNWKSRCHSLGKLTGDYKNQITEKQLETLKELRKKPKMTNKQREEFERLTMKLTGPKELPDTCTSELKKVYNMEVRGFHKDINSKYLEKGQYCEESGIDMLQRTLFHSVTFPLINNKERKSNDYLEGEWDILKMPIVVDVKNCYDWESFENAELSHIYESQLKGYCSLTGATEAILFFCLTNMPDHMMKAEHRKLFYAANKWATMDDPDFEKECDELTERYSFDKFPVYQRFKWFTVTYDPNEMKKVFKRIEECRDWLNKYHEQQLAFHELNKLAMGYKEIPA